MTLASNILNTIKESEELKESRPSLEFNQEDGIHDFVDLIKMDGGKPATKFEEMALELDKLTKVGIYDIHDEWKAKVDKLPTEEQINKAMLKKYEVSSLEDLPEEGKAELEQHKAKLAEKIEEYGQWYDKQSDELHARIGKLKHDMDMEIEDERGDRWFEWKEISRAEAEEFDKILKTAFKSNK